MNLTIIKNSLSFKVAKKEDGDFTKVIIIDILIFGSLWILV